ncbi:MAG: SsrA-binding protein SmpB [Acidobacteriota bacterium]|nr:SsrA-binding protein SmpB [Acidobacteriota bacterium]
MKKNDKNRGPLAQNKRAHRNYDLLETMEAGIMLTGTEVKAARRGQVQLKDAFVELRHGEPWLLNAHISPYSHGNIHNHDPERPRKLLLHRREIDKLVGRVQQTGLTIVPLKVFASGAWIKVEIAVAQGKKLHDKRQRERERELDREVAEARKGRW